MSTATIFLSNYYELIKHQRNATDGTKYTNQMTQTKFEIYPLNDSILEL